MNQNIFQVINEDHVDEILTQHRLNLTIVMLSAKNCGPCKHIKPAFVNLAKQYKDIFCVYIDRDNYLVTKGKHFMEYESTPTFVFYFDNKKITEIIGSHEPALLKVVLEIRQKIEIARQQYYEQEKAFQMQKMQELEKNFPVQQNINVPNEVPQKSDKTLNMNNHPTTELVMQKMEILNKLRSFGVKNYTLDTDFEELVMAYQYHMSLRSNNQPSQSQSQPQPQPQQPLPQLQILPQQVPSQQQNMNNNDLLKKQEQVKQICELDKLHQMMQLESLKKFNN